MHIGKPRRAALLACVSAVAICASGTMSAQAQDRIYASGNAVLNADETIAGSLIIGQGGTANVSIEDVIIDVDNLVLIGDQVGDLGYLIVQQNGQLNAPVGEISLGRSGGTGYLQILTGADVTALTTMIGGLGTGWLTVDGAGSTLTTDYIRVGTSVGEGYLTVSGGGLVSSANNALLGELNGASGTVTVTGGGSRWDHQGDLYVGDRGEGDLQITAGGAVSSYIGIIGDDAGSTGVATVTGPGSSWSNSLDLHVGDEGNGTLTITDGGRVENLNGLIGYSDSAGAATVSGTNSLWTNVGSVHVGRGGDGTLTVAAGGQVTSGVGYIGYFSSSTSSATVTGTGSLWAIGNGLVLGNDGDGTLTIAAGGRVTNTNGFLGYGASYAAGHATVTGGGSLWDNTQDLYIGRYGEGTLTLANQGVARLAGGTGIAHVGFASGSVGVLNIGAAAVDTAVAAGMLEAGEVRFGPGSSALIFNHTDDDYVFAPLITGAGAFTVRGLPVVDDALVAELGLEVELNDRLDLSVDWSGQLASKLNAHALAAMLSWRF